MTNENASGLKTSVVVTSVDHIHDQMASNPHYPFNIQSQWLPTPASPAWAKFLDAILNADPTAWAPSIQALDDLLAGNDVLTFLIDDATAQNGNIFSADAPGTDVAIFPKIASKADLLNAFNALLDKPPFFIDDELVGLPFSAVVVGIDPTQSGMTLFRLPMFNDAMKAILTDWQKFLGSPASNTIFSVEGEQWLSPVAKQQYQFEVWKRDNEALPYWNSWNSFFTREFKDPDRARPITAPTDNSIVVSANDGSQFRWDEDLKATDVYWFKDMPYSLDDILSSREPNQQAIIDQHCLVELFTDGSIFQTYLNPYNFHRWWCPVNGTVLFNPLSIPGDYFNKLVIPDFGGATTASLPYLVQVNARGLMVIETDDFGFVCCIPLGMSEVSTINFDEKMAQNNPVIKGQEMGMFQYGGSSYVLIFQKLPGKKLFFQSASGLTYEKRPVLPKGSASTGANVTMIGSQIAKWQDVDFVIESTQPWQNAGYVNTGKRYTLAYIGGLWTANPDTNDGNLYGPGGSSIVARQPGYPMVGQPEGALVARVGDNVPFLVGAGPVTTPAGQVGHLQLVINDDLLHRYGAGLADNEGAITVSITPA